MPADAGCDCEPWVNLKLLGAVHLLEDEGVPTVTCPDRMYCLRGAEIRDGRIAEHHRNIPGECPWVGIRVRLADDVCEHGLGPYITTRQLRNVLRGMGRPHGPIQYVGCPGGCRNMAPVRNGVILAHGRCQWAGVRVIDQGTHPPLFRPPRAKPPEPYLRALT